MAGGAPPSRPRKRPLVALGRRWLALRPPEKSAWPPAGVQEPSCCSFWRSPGVERRSQVGLDFRLRAGERARGEGKRSGSLQTGKRRALGAQEPRDTSSSGFPFELLPAGPAASAKDGPGYQSGRLGRGFEWLDSAAPPACRQQRLEREGRPGESGGRNKFAPGAGGAGEGFIPQPNKI